MKGQLSSFLSIADAFVFASILLLTVAVIIWGQSKKATNQDSEAALLDHLILGRQLTLPYFVATLVASWYGGIFGVSEITFRHGIFNFVTQGVFWYVIYIIFALFLVERIRVLGPVTLPELVHKTVGPRAAKVAAVFNFFNVIPAAYALSLGIFLDMLTGWGPLLSTSVGVGAVALYSMWGGIRADIHSDLVQFVVMCTSVAMVALLSWQKFGGVEFLQEHLPPSHFELFGDQGFLAALVWGLIALATLVDPNFYQRVLAAKDVRVARRGILICTLIWCVFDICTTAGAMYARALRPLDEPAKAYLWHAISILPAGARGFFLAGIVAIIISTLDSFMLIAAQTLSYDLAPPKWGKKIITLRLATVLVAAIAVLLSLHFQGSVKAAWKTLGSYSAASLLVPMMVALFFPRRLSEKGFITASISAAVCVSVWRNIPRSGLWAKFDGLYIGIAVCTVIVGLDILRRRHATQADKTKF